MWKVVFYTTARGESPVTEYVNKLTDFEQVRIDNEIKLLKEYGTALRPPQIGQIDGKLWELRPYQFRMFYFLYSEMTYMIVHVCRKQSQKTKIQDKKLAIKRMKEFTAKV